MCIKVMSTLFMVAVVLYKFQNKASSSLLVVFSACGRIRTSSRMPVLTAYFPVLA